MTRADWEKVVLETHRNKCANCGSDSHVRAKMIVPLETGGTLSLSNGTVLCRACDMATDTRHKEKKGENRRPIDFWISRKLHSNVTHTIETRNGFNGMGQLVRFVMSKYVVQTDRFEDLEMFQDEGTDVKINVWVPEDTYGTFKALVNERGMTVTDAVKALLLMYQAEAAPALQRTERS
jgi:hypothetical protein